ncbi:hypothetical protein MBM_09272 [Drepanopeziza brunnea f. sp. 'multigermtubi' MB_m1]|uniref:Uncharacterized protein n=1 Tax=Marssonina brunnea f. sp. multigermtubi (strain MB_m1) TaxID=1072389 RepID=K1WI35_MARBU|nr:uncharacterized protein MBM_09272 [Drepanopeziza brunnea f. sp. 'multigermtubi' MB_m1]EKD12516.1 hypothetical protein MBM_09272 [Drepanopeziza brunnea f. sp. 'multigermtubi' MB_m1]
MQSMYSVCKNVLETIIARMNPASTSTAAVADIRRAIAFATEITQPLLKNESSRPSKASKAYASSSELFDQHQHSSQHSLQHSSQTLGKADSDDLENEYESFVEHNQPEDQQATIEYFTTECFAIASTLTTSRLLRIYYERSLPAIQQ